MHPRDLAYNYDAMIQAVLAAKKSLKLHDREIPKKDKLIAINFREPSYRKRLYVWDLEKNDLDRAHHVAHGAGSSKADKAYCDKFSNVPESHKSSLGAFRTDEIYKGKHGRSMRLHGLDFGVNNNAFDRAIVVHSAPYVTDKYILRIGRAGQSWGCFVIDPYIRDAFIDEFNDGYMIYAYY